MPRGEPLPGRVCSVGITSHPASLAEVLLGCCVVGQLSSISARLVGLENIVGPTEMALVAKVQGYLVKFSGGPDPAQ